MSHLVLLQLLVALHDGLQMGELPHVHQGPKQSETGLVQTTGQANWARVGRVRLGEARIKNGSIGQVNLG